MTKGQSLNLFHKHIHKLDIKKHIFITHFFLIISFILSLLLLGFLWYILFFQYINFSSPVDSLADINLDLTGRNFGLYSIKGSNNNFFLGWEFWVSITSASLIILFFVISLILDHTWHFKLLKHKISYFMVIPVIILSVSTWTLSFFSLPINYDIISQNGGAFTSWKNLITKFIIEGDEISGWHYSNYFTPIGMIFFIVTFLVAIYEVKLVIVYIHEVKTKWGHDVHINLKKYQINKKVDGETLKNIFHHKKVVALYLSLFDIFLTLIISSILICLVLFIPQINNLFNGEDVKFWVLYITIPCIIFTYLIADIFIFVSLWKSVRRRNEKRNQWFDILTIVFGGTLSNAAGLILLTDFYYARNQHEHLILQPKIQVQNPKVK
ncbi:MAG: hypothetical protein LBF02_00135 [Mycoplasmataceae bacterium]|nr:hypothetical protein [Mycoplasmataceae bacterium]